MVTLTVVLVCVAAALVCSVLRVSRPEMAMGVALAAGVAALFLLGAELRTTIDTVISLAGQASVSDENTALLLRASGIALISQFGAEICRDAGESALAGRIELAVRVALLAMAAPLISQMLALISGILA